ncbi:MAG: hypothetical protein J6Y92_06535 [Lentisphaeria bacterium]|nr:hypothetical protein [Lentisphaeria bacterium]
MSNENVSERYTIHRVERSFKDVSKKKSKTFNLLSIPMKQERTATALFWVSLFVRADGFSAYGQTRQCRKIRAWLPERNQLKPYQLDFARVRKAAENQLMEEPFFVQPAEDAHGAGRMKPDRTAFLRDRAKKRELFRKTGVYTLCRESTAPVRTWADRREASGQNSPPPHRRSFSTPTHF